MKRGRRILIWYLTAALLLLSGKSGLYVAAEAKEPVSEKGSPVHAGAAAGNIVTMEEDPVSSIEDTGDKGTGASGLHSGNTGTGSLYSGNTGSTGTGSLYSGNTESTGTNGLYSGNTGSTGTDGFHSGNTGSRETEFGAAGSEDAESETESSAHPGSLQEPESEETQTETADSGNTGTEAPGHMDPAVTPGTNHTGTGTESGSQTDPSVETGGTVHPALPGGTEEPETGTESESYAETEGLSGEEGTEETFGTEENAESGTETEDLSEEMESVSETMTETADHDSEIQTEDTEFLTDPDEEQALETELWGLADEEGSELDETELEKKHKRDYSALTDLLKAWWDSMQLAFVTKVLQLILAFVLFFTGRRIINSIIRVMDKIAEKKGWDPTVCSFARNAMRALLYLCLLMIILTCVGVQVTSLAAIISSIGVALGLALQGSLSNLAGGILISFIKPIHLGDFINVAGYSGTVREIGLVYTTLVGADDRTVVIPNSTLTSSVIENYSEQTTRRVEVQCSIAYDADLKLAMNIFRRVLEAIPERLPDKPVNVFIANLGESGVVLEGQIYVQWTKYLSALWTVRQNIKLEYDAAGIEIPLPQIDVNMKNSGQQEKW